MLASEYLDIDAFYERLKTYLVENFASDEALAFEKGKEEDFRCRLLGQGREGWDFETNWPFFNDRGVSILIQNESINWRPLWHELMGSDALIPSGALLNFEVYDRIQNNVWVSGKTICRHVITSTGVFSLKV